MAGVFGGEEVYLKNISLSLSDKYSLYFYVPDSKRGLHSCVLLDENEKYIRKCIFSTTTSSW